MDKRLVFFIISIIFSVSVQGATVSGQGSWESVLQARDLDGDPATVEAFYNVSTDTTWLADANLAQTSGFDSDGLLNWYAANSWAESLNFNGVTGWRLPSTSDFGNDGYSYLSTVYVGLDAGYNIRHHSEMSGLFYDVLGNSSAYNTNGTRRECAITNYPDYCLTNSGEFSINPGTYWSSTEFVNNPGEAWVFDFASGFQGSDFKARVYYAWAVHAGDVGVAVIPLPTSVWLFISGLVCLISVGRKDKKSSI